MNAFIDDEPPSEQKRTWTACTCGPCESLCACKMPFDDFMGVKSEVTGEPRLPVSGDKGEVIIAPAVGTERHNSQILTGRCDPLIVHAQ